MLTFVAHVPLCAACQECLWRLAADHPKPVEPEANLAGFKALRQAA